MTLSELFKNIADAIREKDSSTEPIPATTFPYRISSLIVDKIVPTDVYLEGLYIERAPDKIEYKVGEFVSLDGAIFKARFSNKMDLVIPLEYLFYSPVGELSEDDDEITVSFRWDSVQKETTFPIRVTV